MKPDDRTPPRVISAISGDLKLPPKRLRQIFQCPVCGKWLERGPEFWTCPDGGAHIKAITDDVLAETLQAKMMTYKRWTAEGIIAVQKAVSRWRIRILTRRDSLRKQQQVASM